MPPVAKSAKTSASMRGTHSTIRKTKLLSWRPTKIMNMRDLSRDDDFLSHLLVEKLGTRVVPLVVHKMDPSRRLPKAEEEQLLYIVRRLIAFRGASHLAIREAVNELLALPAIVYWVRSYTEKQINAFATHASRYFELYLPTGSIEIAHTSRYTHRTGKSELCILATRPLAPGTVITELKGSMAHLTEDEDRELKRTQGTGDLGIRRDFSVIHSKQLKKNHLFLGPARFVNHDCDHNCELFREGRYITFRVIKFIKVGEEITAHYGDGYFGRNNRHCLCDTCEKAGRGGYAAQPDQADEMSESDSGSNSGSDSDSDTAASGSGNELEDTKPVNVNERRTRRGVYAVVQTEEQEESEEEDEGEEEGGEVVIEVPGDGDIETETTMSALTPLPRLGSEMISQASSTLSSPPPFLSGPHDTFFLSSSAPPLSHTASGPSTLPVPSTSSPALSSLSSPPLSSLSSLSSAPSPLSSTPAPTSTFERPKTPFKSVIQTRRQKAQSSTMDSSPIVTTNADVHGNSNGQLITPPLTEKSTSISDDSPSKSGVDRVLRPRASMPSISYSITRRRKGKEADIGVSGAAGVSVSAIDVQVKTEDKSDEQDTQRVLRARRSLPSLSAAKGHENDLKPKPKQRGGRRPPTCGTCSNVMPVFYVDHKVVWGLNVSGSGKGKGKKKEDCPRCLRHFAIYGQPWPSRISPHGSASFPITPPEEDVAHESPAPVARKVTQKDLPALDRKLLAVSSSSYARAHQVPQKRPVGRPRKKVKLEDVEQNLKRRVGRPPSRVADVSPTKRRLPAEVRPLSIQNRGEGRHDEASRDTVSDSDDGDDHSQPRDNHGRFGRKDGADGHIARRKLIAQVNTGGRMARAERALNRHRAKARREAEVQASLKEKEMSALKRKREHEDSPRRSKRLRHEDAAIDVDDAHHDDDLMGQAVLPLRFSVLTATSYNSQRHGGLSSKPNPGSFARWRWAPQPTVDSGLRVNATGERNSDTLIISDDDDTDPPVTPEEDRGPSIRFADSSDSDTMPRSRKRLRGEEPVHTPVPVKMGMRVDNGDDDEVKLISPPPRRLLPSLLQSRSVLTCRPSPINFARRRWAPPATPDMDSRSSSLTQLSSSPGSSSSANSEDVFGVDLTTDADKRTALPVARTQGIDTLDIELSSGEEDVIFPSSPEPAKFALQRTATFSADSRSNPADMTLYDDAEESDQAVEGLVTIASTSSTLPSSRDDGSTKSPLKLTVKMWKKSGDSGIPAFLQSRLTMALEAGVPSVPAKLVNAGWDSGSETESIHL